MQRLRFQTKKDRALARLGQAKDYLGNSHFLLTGEMFYVLRIHYLINTLYHIRGDPSLPMVLYGYHRSASRAG